MASMQKIKELQANRESLYNDVCEVGNREEKNAEWEQEWNRVNDAYDQNMKELEQAKKDLARTKAVEERFRTLERGVNVNSGSDHDAAMNVASVSEFRQHQAIALQGWWQNAVDPSRVTDAHRASAAACRVNLGHNEFILNLMPDNEFRQMQARHQTTAPQDGLVRRAMNAMQGGDAVSGGFLVGETLLRSIEEAMLDYSGVMQVAEIMRTPSGEPLKWPTMDDTGNTGTRVGEGADAGNATDPTLGQQVWHAHTFTSSTLKVSRSLLNDSIVSLERIIGEMLGTRLGRKQNTDYTLGYGGGNAPQGIVPGSTLGVTAASGTAIVFDEVIDLEYAIDLSRRNRGSYMMHDNIVKVIRKLKDGNGDYLWSRGTEAGQPDRLNGYPFFTNADMQSSVATATKTMLFGELSAYKVRQVGSIKLQRLVERGAEFDQDWFIAYLRGDGGVLNAGDNPIKHLLQA